MHATYPRTTLLVTFLGQLGATFLGQLGATFLGQLGATFLGQLGAKFLGPLGARDGEPSWGEAAQHMSGGMRRRQRKW